MLTLDALRADMAASGRALTPRAARDWWTKGLLPRPQRHGLGRGKGTQTFWSDPAVFQQARAVHDLLALYPRAYAALLGLWLRGFPVELHYIRSVYAKLINRHCRSIRGRAGQQPDDVVSKIAAMIARQRATVPMEARRALADLAFDFLEIFYGLETEVVSEGMAALWEKAAPYLGGGVQQPNGFTDLHPEDEDLASWARYLREMASLTAQQRAITSATDYELARARRLVHLVFGYLGRLAWAAGAVEQFEEFGRRFLIMFGRPAIPILVMVLRKDFLRETIISYLLGLAPQLRRLPEQPILDARSPATWSFSRRLAEWPLH